ncbi:twin-arginine translocase TatA/TatE family subunit [Desulfococcaceae bacterium HSG9]|nr:twin-arginine translocase TatA/TatE family subunit [Desulfococcaceae bacterium HSG9]
MFGMGMPEILLILGIALIVIGPKKLPGLAKSLGRALGEFKQATSDLKESMQIDSELTDVKNAFDDMNSDTDKPSAGKKKAVADIKTEGEAVADDNPDKADRDKADQYKDVDSSKPSSFSDDQSDEMTDAPLTPPAENDNNVPISEKTADHPDVTNSDKKNKDI